ncbi:hypothetical protein QQX98_008410 [Neonectria punicea]|uniref:Aminoglycoside phosphotransferase domain-containing protein n=1 Tax=Neonectria punicea TaxID=979145 RepID=A0ABR1GV47_9HYPO
MPGNNEDIELENPLDIIGAFSIRKNELLAGGYTVLRIVTTSAKEFFDEQLCILQHMWTMPYKDLDREQAEREEFAQKFILRAGPNKVVQFREQGNSLDEGMVALARAVHPEVVASCALYRLIGGLPSDPEAKSSALAIYSIDNHPGNNYVYMRGSLAESLPLQLATVESQARFFTQSWLSGRPTDPAQVSTTADECAAIFRYLSDNLPSRFKPYVAQIQGILPMLRSGEHPVVLTHGDLNEMNILVDPASGKITGVVDWQFD